MINSKMGICNLALAAIGEASIRDFSEGNKRARMCDTFYDALLVNLLSQFNWTFARKQAKLQRISEPVNWLPEGSYAYALPSDCKTPIDLYPEGTRQNWEIIGTEFVCPYDDDFDVVLRYTALVIDPAKFSAPFYNLLAAALAVKICPSLSQDEKLTKTLFQQYQFERAEVWAGDATIGVVHKHNDDNHDYDSFVRPDSVQDDDSMDLNARYT